MEFAIVMSMLHPHFKVVVKLKRGGETGTIDWDGLSPNFVTLRAIPKSAKVSVGDTVITSLNFLPFSCQPDGRNDRRDRARQWQQFYTLKVRTATTFPNIEYVYVIDNTQYDEQKALEDSTRKKFQ